MLYTAAAISKIVTQDYTVNCMSDVYDSCETYGKLINMKMCHSSGLIRWRQSFGEIRT